VVGSNMVRWGTGVGFATSCGPRARDPVAAIVSAAITARTTAPESGLSVWISVVSLSVCLSHCISRSAKMLDYFQPVRRATR